MPLRGVGVLDLLPTKANSEKSEDAKPRILNYFGIAGLPKRTMHVSRD